MFSTTLPSAFENLSLTFYTLFVCITQDSWMDTYKILQEYNLLLSRNIHQNIHKLSSMSSIKSQLPYLFSRDEIGNTFWTLLYFSTFILSSGLMLSMFDAWIQGNFIVAQKQQAEQERLTVNALFKVRTRNRFPLLTWAIKGQFTLQRQTQTDCQQITVHHFSDIPRLHKH